MNLEWICCREYTASRKSLLYFRILFIGFLQTTCWYLNFGGERVHARTRAVRGDLSPVSHLQSSASSFACVAHFARWIPVFAAPAGRVFAPFWYENGYTLYPFWSEIGYGFRGNYERACARRVLLLGTNCWRQIISFSASGSFLSYSLILGKSIRVTDDLWPGKVTICLLYFQVFDSFTLLGLPQSRRAMSRTWLRAALQKRGNVGTQKRKNGTSHIFNGKWKNGNSVEVGEGGWKKFKIDYT